MAALSYQERVARVRDAFSTYHDFPKPGIIFRDIFPVMRNPELFRDCIALLVEQVREYCKDVEVIVGLESRGFIIGPLIADQLNVAFVPVRKAGKLPGELISASYTKEYGTDVFEAQKDSIKPGQKVIIVDDLLATGGTLIAAIELMEKMKAVVQECVVVVELSGLKGREKIKPNVFSLVSFSDS